MRIIEIINLALKYNELLLKYHKGSIWLDKPNVSQELKDSFIPKWDKLLDEMDQILIKFEKIGITFCEYESLEVIELPNEFKRQDVEIYLQNYYMRDKHNNYDKIERKGIKLF